MVHSEQMLTLDGPIKLGVSKVGGRERIENRSQLHLQSVGIIRRLTEEDRLPGGEDLMGMWVGELQPAQSVPIALLPLRLDGDEVPFAAEREAELNRLSGEPLDLEPMFRLAYDQQDMEPGEMRLAARLDGLLPGETASPEASQTRGATLVVAHLQYGPLPPPLPDLNTRQSVTNSSQE